MWTDLCHRCAWLRGRPLGRRPTCGQLTGSLLTDAEAVSVFLFQTTGQRAFHTPLCVCVQLFPKDTSLLMKLLRHQVYIFEFFWEVVLNRPPERRCRNTPPADMRGSGGQRHRGALPVPVPSNPPARPDVRPGYLSLCC